MKSIIIFHTLCASYHSSPKVVASKENRARFLQMGVSARRYKIVWSALCGTGEKRGRLDYSENGWMSRSHSVRAILLDLELDLAAINRRLLYVPGSTIFYLDDDLLRLSSRSVSLLTNLRQINNPDKALNPVSNGLCSALTSVYIAGHYSRRKEEALEIWIRLLQLVQGDPTKGALLPMPDATFASDRGYNCAQSTKFVSNLLGAKTIGTHKRSYEFPFVFGDWPIRKKHKGMVFSEKGCRAVNYATQQGRRGSYNRQIQAAVYRESYYSRVAAVYTNNERLFSASKFTLVPKDSFRGICDAGKIKALSIVFDLSLNATHRNGDEESHKIHLKDLHNSVHFFLNQSILFIVSAMSTAGKRSNTISTSLCNAIATYS